MIDTEKDGWENPLDFIDLWVIDRFGVLPTDKRFVELESEQKVALFKLLNMFPDRKEIAKKMKKASYINKIKNIRPEKFLSRGAIKRLTELFTVQGMRPEEIEGKLREHAERLKAAKLKIDSKEN